MPVFFVPGFAQTASSWSGVVPLVPDALALDVPVRDTFAATAAAIGASNGEGIYVGYSMGGRLCLRLALDRPDLVQALVLVSTAPGIADRDARAARIESDAALAQSVENDGVEQFLDRWLAQPLFAGVTADAPGVADRRSLTPEFVAHGLRTLGAGVMPPMWDRLGELRMPVAVVTGDRDTKYTEIAVRMIERMTVGVLQLTLEGGHALPQECPAELGAFVAAFAAEH